ncbi:hypothetical protein DAPPUDRAFT_252962 [Daphnia pulex]|uniref:Uncharacterized protein n=1 Tax=Daphnia pulex TaxID=6669 RepID=E9H3W5_DAPPU|nr:hypothetical protein DAPPUDRAFT_252962 [Daphnia pulex]|eukprot:EFX73599.1 hypothetical protein DAPPUDRAFT_252962 [Daphnia pulex]
MKAEKRCDTSVCKQLRQSRWTPHVSEATPSVKTRFTGLVVKMRLCWNWLIGEVGALPCCDFGLFLATSNI